MSFLYALRLGRWGVAGFGALAFVLTLLQSAGFYQVAGRTAAERAAFGRSMAQIAGQFSVIIPPPVRPDTVGGYVQWRAYGALAILFAVWALASAAGAARGDEEKGLVEAVLAAGVTRADALAARFAAFALSAAAAAAAAGLGYAVALDRAHEPIDLGGAAGAGLVLAGLGLACYAITLLVCQLAPARAATAASGAVLLALFLLNSLARTLDALRAWRWLSPFHYFDASQPLAPGGAMDLRATEVLLAIAVVSGLGAALGFSYRDLGAPLWRPPAPARSAPRHSPASSVWRVPVLRGLYRGRAGLAAWIAAFAILAAVFVVLTKEMVKPLLGLQGLQPYFNGIIQGDLYPSFLGFVWLGFAQLLVAGFAITQVARWSSEDGDGRLELMLSRPVSRTAVIVERAAVLVVAALLIAIAGALGVAAQAGHESIHLNAGRLAAATLLLVPFAAFFAAIGSVLAAWRPRAALGLVGGIAIAGYFVTQLGPLFDWPAWVQDLSAFHLYGQPLTSGIDGIGLAIMLLVGVVGFAASALLMQRRDIGA